MTCILLDPFSIISISVLVLVLVFRRAWLQFGFFFLSTFLSLFAESHRKLLKSIRRARAKRVKFLLAKAHCKNLTTSQYQDNPRVIFAQKIRRSKIRDYDHSDEHEGFQSQSDLGAQDVWSHGQPRPGQHEPLHQEDGVCCQEGHKIKIIQLYRFRSHTRSKTGNIEMNRLLDVKCIIYIF